MVIFRYIWFITLAFKWLW